MHLHFITNLHFNAMTVVKKSRISEYGTFIHYGFVQLK